MYRNGLKRGIDFILALCGLIVLSPIFLILCIWIKLDSKGPILFKQKRIGINKSYFNIYKFRTMYVDTPKDMPTHMLSNPDQYITKSGKFLRKTSLDELPQLLNILTGDMSFVGPRPIIDDEIKKYGMNKDKLLSVTPGLTGWWACNGRSCTSYEDRMKLELFYVDNRSILLDIKIFIKTFISVIKRNGAK